MDIETKQQEVVTAMRDAAKATGTRKAAQITWVRLAERMLDLLEEAEEQLDKEMVK